MKVLPGKNGVVSHWHECTGCERLFECRCDGPEVLSRFCEGCLFMDRVARDLVSVLAE